MHAQSCKSIVSPHTRCCRLRNCLSSLLKFVLSRAHFFCAPTSVKFKVEQSECKSVFNYFLHACPGQNKRSCNLLEVSNRQRQVSSS